MTEAELLTLLFERAANMSLGYEVVLPRTAYQPKKDETYLDVAWLPNESTDAFVGDDTPTWHQGILQIAVMTPEGTSLVDAATVVDQVVGYWEKGTVIYGSSFKIKINRKPWPAPSFKDEGWDRLPISISYKVTA